jgi:hypothetical protein
MGRNIVKVLEKKFADMKAGDRMYISSPEEIKSFIINIPRGTSKSLKEMRLDLANTNGADNTCPVTTGIFLRMVIEDNIENFPYWRIIDQNHSLVTKLNLNKEFIINQRSLETIESD